MTALARHKGPLRLVGRRTRIIVFIRYVRISIQLPCPRVTFYYVILENVVINARYAVAHSYLLCTLAPSDTSLHHVVLILCNRTPHSCTY